MKSLITISGQRQFCLSNDRISYLFRVSPEGLLEHLHFGKRINAELDLPAVPRRAFRCAATVYQGIDNYNLSDIAQEYPLFGNSDTRHPALHLVNADGNTSTTLLYQSHVVVQNKPALPGLPSARGGDSESLIVTLCDVVSDIRVELCYTVYREHDVIARSVEVFNDGDQSVSLCRVASASLDLPATDYELLHLRGTWAREFNVIRMPLAAGRFTIESASGASSNHHNPFLAVMQKGADEQHGNVIGTALVYSGNFAITAEQGEFDSVRISAGINPFNFNWQLAPGESFTSPEVLQVFSDAGLEKMSLVWHAFVREKICPPQFNGIARPTYLNSWEAAYFDLNEEVVLGLADKAKALGVEMLVVDDGWFAGRNDDTTSLGDWYSDPDKFPNGIESVATRVKQKGLKFGLWFEPEMVNPDSELYRQHPEWVIHVPGRTLSTGRNQLILDLSRAEVVDYLYQRIDAILACGDIDYVKWDMNRVMTEVGSAGLDQHRQLETPHRYMLGVYDLVARLVSRYPHILFENCASGGNRFDLGMLCYMAQGWVSDMSEPIGRLAIVDGASYLYPPSVLASYIGPVPSHQNDRQASLKLRTEVGFFCAARGISLNQQDIEEEFDGLVQAVALYRDTADDIVSGEFRRLINTDNEVCWQLTTRDQSTVYLGYFHILSAPNLPYQRVYIRGLDPAAQYRLQDSDSVFAGDALMAMGLDLPYVHAMQLDEQTHYMDRGDFSSCLLVLQRVDV